MRQLLKTFTSNNPSSIIILKILIGLMFGYLLINKPVHRQPYIDWNSGYPEDAGFREQFPPKSRDGILDFGDLDIQANPKPDPRIHTKYFTNPPQTPTTIRSCRNLTKNPLLQQTLQNHIVIDDQPTEPTPTPPTPTPPTPTPTPSDNWNLYITCKDDYKDGKIDKINKKLNHKSQKIMGVSGKWVLGSKAKLWKALEHHLGRRQASLIMPQTYILSRDMNLFIRDFNPKNLYFLKNDLQRQQGLEITNLLERIKKARQEGYLVVQEYLKYPYLFRGYKINLRFYLLVVCEGKSKRKRAYLYHDGIVSYGGQPYQLQEVSKSTHDYHANHLLGPTFNDQHLSPNDPRPSPTSKPFPTFNQAVASFYQSKPLYASGFPITWSQFREDLPYKGSKIFDKVKCHTRQIMNSTQSQLCNFKFKHHNTSFEIFGIDIYLSKTLDPFVLEINVGPGMTPANSQDEILRKKIYTDMFDLLQIIPQPPTPPSSPNNKGFIQIWEK